MSDTDFVIRLNGEEVANAIGASVAKALMPSHYGEVSPLIRDKIKAACIVAADALVRRPDVLREIEEAMRRGIIAGAESAGKEAGEKGARAQLKARAAGALFVVRK
jgi:hypothetical protein